MGMGTKETTKVKSLREVRKMRRYQNTVISGVGIRISGFVYLVCDIDRIVIYY